ncbi:MAG: hypothetical protein ACKVHE_33300 [Planctomycetales bacterium]|jgi:hypothetical protein
MSEKASTGLAIPCRDAPIDTTGSPSEISIKTATFVALDAYGKIPVFKYCAVSVERASTALKAEQD